MADKIKTIKFGKPPVIHVSKAKIKEPKVQHIKDLAQDQLKTRAVKGM